MFIEVTEEQAARDNEAYDEGLRLVRRHLLIDGEPQRGAPGWIAQWRLRRGISHFQRALEIAPFKWECEFWIGKAFQRLGDARRASEWFERALLQVPANVSVIKEVAGAALEHGDFLRGEKLL